MDILSSFAMSSHGDHDVKWTVPRGNSGEPLCLACLMEFIENPDILVLKKKHALLALQEILQNSSRAVKQMLETEAVITQHMSFILVGNYFTRVSSRLSTVQ